jgi:Kef-type K+ transport system membrane component KefB
LINIVAVLTVTLPLVAILTVAVFGKFAGCWMGAKLSTTKHDASRVGMSMLPRGEFSFIVASEGTGLGIASQILFPIAGLTTIITSTLSSIGLKLLKKRGDKPKSITSSVEKEHTTETQPQRGSPP